MWHILPTVLLNTANVAHLSALLLNKQTLLIGYSGQTADTTGQTYIAAIAGICGLAHGDFTNETKQKRNRKANTEIRSSQRKRL